MCSVCGQQQWQGDVQYSTMASYSDVHGSWEGVLRLVEWKPYSAACGDKKKRIAIALCSTVPHNTRPALLYLPADTGAWEDLLYASSGRLVEGVVILLCARPECEPSIRLIPTFKEERGHGACTVPARAQMRAAY